MKNKPKKGSLLIELSERVVKVLQVAGEGSQRKVVYLNALEVASQDEEEVAKQLSTLLKQIPLKSDRVFASIPRSQVTTRTPVLPSTQPSELLKIVEFQIEKLIPFPKEKIIFDYRILETTPEGYSRLLLVIAGEEVIRRDLAILKRVGLSPESIFFSSEGLVAWLNLVQGEKKEDGIFSVLVDVDLFTTHVEVLRGGELYFTRSFSIGSRQLGRGKEDPSQEAFFQELKRTFVAFKKEFPPGDIHHLFLSGSAGILPSVQRIVSSQLSIPIEAIDFKAHCPLETSVLPEEGFLQEVSFSSSAGLLLRERKNIDLIPHSIKEARVRRTFRRTATQFFALLAGSFFLLSLMFGRSLQSRRQTLLSLETQLHEVEPVATQMESMHQQLEVLKARSAQSEAMLELLRELYRLIPQETSLTFLLLEPGHLSLQGGSKDLAPVFQFAKSLESSPLFKSVQVKNATRRTLSEGEITYFRIDALLETKEVKKK
ncbi:MAG: pilus assembly protein PilM [Candidatus Omnitrophica bacterium]|nr:pilus assembly protein PilM [Candidatus Omnitrophota bacterium]